MSWGQPLILWALLLLPLVAWLLLWANQQRQQALAQLGDVSLLVAGRSNGRFRQSILWLLASASLIIALAHPQWGQQPPSAPPRPLQIIFVLDVSHSMLAADAPPDRFTQARNTILTLLPSLTGAEIGLLLFAGQSSLNLPLTADHQLFQTHLAQVRPDTISPQGTALAEAIETAVTAFSPLQYSQKIILILSDGENQQQPTTHAVQTAVANHITIHTIGFGSAEGAPLPTTADPSRLKIDGQGSIVMSRLNQAALQQIANEGHGRYFTPESDGEAIISALTATSQPSDSNATSIERFQLFLLVTLTIFYLLETSKNQQTLPEFRRK